jgi:hypothetical protein
MRHLTNSDDHLWLLNRRFDAECPLPSAAPPKLIHNAQKPIDVVSSCRTDQVGLSEFVVLHGEIGTGKSHALRYLQHYITVKNAAEFRSPCVYLESTKLAKTTDFLAIYRRVMEALRGHAFETAAKLDAAMEEKAKAGGLTRSQDIQREKYGLWKASAETLAPQFPSLILLLHGMVNSEHPFSILCGAKAKDIEAFQLTGPIDSEYDASRCLSTYVNLVTNPNRSVLPENLFAANLSFTFSSMRSSFFRISSPAMCFRSTKGSEI